MISRKTNLGYYTRICLIEVGSALFACTPDKCATPAGYRGRYNDLLFMQFDLLFGSSPNNGKNNKQHSGDDLEFLGRYMV